MSPLPLQICTLLCFHLWHSSYFSQAVLSLGTIDILDLESLCCVCSPVHFKMLSSIPGFYPLDVSSIPKLWQSKLFPKTNEVAQSCPTLCDPMDCNLPGSSIHGICQARVLEWAAIAFSVNILWVHKSVYSLLLKVLHITNSMCILISLFSISWLLFPYFIPRRSC